MWLSFYLKIMYKEGEFMELISVIVPLYNVEKYLD